MSEPTKEFNDLRNSGYAIEGFNTNEYVVCREGKEFICYGPEIRNLQDSSAYAFGDTPEDALKNYLLTTYDTFHDKQKESDKQYEYPFATEFRRLRTLKDVTLRELSEATGELSISYLSDVEHGQRLPPHHTYVAQIEQRLGVPSGSLESIRRLDELVRRLERFSDDELRDELKRRCKEQA